MKLKSPNNEASVSEHSFKKVLLGIILLASASTHAGTNIVNGTTVESYDEVSYSTVKIIGPGSLCTATLLSENIAITAAHCVSDRNRKLYNYNSMYIESNPEVSGELQRAQVKGVYWPNAYAENSYNHLGNFDYAIIYFNNFNSNYHRPAAILGADYKFNQNQDVVIAGYGTPYGYGQNTDTVLRKKTVSFGSHHQAHEVMLNQYSGGACSGDSGGPAFIERDGQLYFFGVASRVSSNGNGESCRGISIYLNVNQMRESINDYIRQLHRIFGTPVSVQL